MRVLVTGAKGFVAPWFARALRERATVPVEIVGTSKEAGESPDFGRIEALDVSDAAAVEECIARLVPTHILNLAGVAKPSDANANAALARAVHVDGPRNLADAMMKHAPECWLVNVGTGLVFGDAITTDAVIDERTPVAPRDEYQRSKAQGDAVLLDAARRGARTLLLRPFNHTGPGQSSGFVVPDYCARIARIERGLAPAVLSVMGARNQRDLSDVRDVADAYALAILRTGALSPGAIVNIASGVPRTIAEIVGMLASLSSRAITLEAAPETNPPETHARVDVSAARDLLRWTPRRDLRDTLAEVLEEWRRRVT